MGLLNKNQAIDIAGIALTFYKETLSAMNWVGRGGEGLGEGEGSAQRGGRGRWGCPAGRDDPQGAAQAHPPVLPHPLP